MSNEIKSCYKKAGIRLMLLILICGPVLLSMSEAAVAQEYEEMEDSLIHWSFANQLGTGIYGIGEDKEIEFLFHPEKEPLNIGTTWELAIAVGGKEKVRLWLFNLYRVGFAINFGDGHWGFKVVFSSLFYK